MAVNIVGISAFYHDSAVALVRDGIIIAAAQEERFTRKKHDASFPRNALEYCLTEGGVGLDGIDYLVFYDKPLLKFERLLETYLSFAPRGFRSFVSAMPVWLKDKLFLKQTLRYELATISGMGERELPPILFTEHHEAHAASAFYPSPFERAAVLCMDGVGEWATTSAWLGEKNKLTADWQIDFPHSLGLLYSAFTYYTGFRVNSGEYKLMGLAPFGVPRYVDRILENLVDVKPDGSFRLDMRFFSFATGLKMTNSKFDDLFGGAPRKPESELTQKEMDIARSIQFVTEEIVLKLSQTLRQEMGVENLCIAGGVALNCVANGRLVREGPFKQVWFQPAAGDAGGALGAALNAWHKYLGKNRNADGQRDAMQGAYLGCQYQNEDIRQRLQLLGAPFEQLSDEALFDRLAGELADGKVVGWFSGRMEFGPRALGARSIIGDARNPRMQSTMNLKIKYRESFRPFAPAVKAETAHEWFDLDRPSPYMLVVSQVTNDKLKEMTQAQQNLFGIDKLNVPRSEIPAVTHVDYSARVQTVHADTNPRFHRLLTRFEEETGCPVLVNTSFNVRGEPIVCTPEDAYRCFMRTDMDILVMENFVLQKSEQPEMDECANWLEEFELD